MGGFWGKEESKEETRFGGNSYFLMTKTKSDLKRL